MCFFLNKKNEVWRDLKRTKKHVILISQTAHTNPWIYTDPQLIMTPAARLKLEVWRSERPHILFQQESEQAKNLWDDLKKNNNNTTTARIFPPYTSQDPQIGARPSRISALVQLTESDSLCLHKCFLKWNTVSPNMPKHLAYDVHKPHRTQRAYQFISHLMAYFKL